MSPLYVENATGPPRSRVRGTDARRTDGCASATSIQPPVIARSPATNGTALIRYSDQSSSLANVHAPRIEFRARAHRNKRARSPKAGSANECDSDLERYVTHSCN